MQTTQFTLLAVLTVALCSGQMCGDPGLAPNSLPEEQVSSSSANQGQQQSEISSGPQNVQTNAPSQGTDTQPQETTEPAPSVVTCYSGSFECVDGPVATPCGTWQFEVNPAYGISGAATVTQGFPGGELAVELHGAFDPCLDSITIVMDSYGGGAGELTFSLADAGTTVSGHWHHADGPGPTASAQHGVVNGHSCSQSP